METNFKNGLIDKIFKKYKNNIDNFYEINDLSYFVKSYIRHEFTHYEQLLKYGLDKKQARNIIRSKVEKIFKALQKEKKGGSKKSTKGGRRKRKKVAVSINL